MAKYVFTYNAIYEEQTGQEIREEIILFLRRNGARNIEQCLETTFIFDSSERIGYWWDKIKEELDTDGGALEDDFYLLNRVFYTQQRNYEIKKECNRDLQDFVDDVLDK